MSLRPGLLRGAQGCVAALVVATGPPEPEGESVIVGDCNASCTFCVALSWGFYLWRHLALACTAIR